MAIGKVMIRHGGHLTAPVLYALQEEPYLEVLIEREFSETDDLQKALDIVEDSKGIEKSRELAAYHARLAKESLKCLTPSDYTQTLKEITDYALSRLY